MADAGLPWSIPNAGFSIQPINGEFAAWSRGSSVPPDGWSVLSGTWSSTFSRCQGGTGPYAVDFGQAGIPSTLVSDYIVVLPNTRYLLSALYRIVTGSGAALSQGVRVDWYDDSRSLISSNNVDLITNTAGVWTYSGLDITSPIQAVYAKVVAGRFNVNGSTNLQIDAIKLDRAVYIPSGVISLDDVTDGVTYARPRGAYMSGGIINAVIRGAGTVATDFLFKKPNIADPDTLDGVPNGATYGRPKLDALTVSGYPDMDKVVDGATYARIKGTMLTAGEVTSLSRGGTVYATSTFFQKALDNLDSVLDGSSFRKVGTAYVDSSNRVTGVLRGTSPVAGADLFAKTLDTLDNVTDGASFRKVGTAYVDSSNRITGVLRGTSPVAGADLFAKTLDTLDNVSNGTTYARVNATAISSGNPKTDSLVDGTYAKVLATQLTSGAITSLTRGGISYATSTFFNTGLDTLDNVPNGTTYSRVNATALSSGNPKTDSLVDGTYAKVLATQLTSGAVTSLTRGGVSYATTTFFQKALDSLDNVLDGASYRRVAIAYVNASNQITAVRRAGADESVDNLFKKSSDTFASVAGTIATSQFGTGVVNSNALGSDSVTTAKIADLAVTAAELNDGISLSAFDEETVAGISSRTTATNATKGAWDGATNYIRLTLAVGSTNPQLSTGLATGTSTNLKTTHAIMRYRISGGASGAVTKLEAINTANVAQKSSTVFLADDSWHTAVFDISGWATAGTLRLDLTTSALGSTGYWDVAYIATGIPGGGTGALISNAGNVGIGTASPGGYRLTVNGPAAGTAAAPASLSTPGAAQGERSALALFATFQSTPGDSVPRRAADIVAGFNGGNWGAEYLSLHVGNNGSSNDTQVLTSEKVRIQSNGNVGVRTASPRTNLHVYGTSNTPSGSGSTEKAIFIAEGSATNAIKMGTDPASPFGSWMQSTDKTNNGIQYPLLLNPVGGNVGIGTTSPSSKLHVDGTITIGTTTSTYQAGALGYTDSNWGFIYRPPRAGTIAAHNFEAYDGSDLLTVTNGGKVGIGVTAPEEQLEVRTAASAYGLLHSDGTRKVGSYVDTTGGWYGTKSNHDLKLFTNNGASRLTITAAGDVRVPALAGVGNRTVYSDADGGLTNTGSDASLKKDIQSLENALPVVMEMNPVSFSWRDQERFGPYTEVGFLAQEMLELVPFVIGKNADDTFTIDYPKLTAVLARAIQELKQQVDELASSRS